MGLSMGLLQLHPWERLAQLPAWQTGHRGRYWPLLVTVLSFTKLKTTGRGTLYFHHHSSHCSAEGTCPVEKLDTRTPKPMPRTHQSNPLPLLFTLEASNIYLKFCHHFACYQRVCPLLSDTFILCTMRRNSRQNFSFLSSEKKNKIKLFFWVIKEEKLSGLSRQVCWWSTLNMKQKASFPCSFLWVHLWNIF